MIESQSVRIACDRCRSIYSGEILVGVSCKQAVAFMRNMRCERCGSKQIGFVTGSEAMVRQQWRLKRRRRAMRELIESTDLGCPVG